MMRFFGVVAVFVFTTSAAADVWLTPPEADRVEIVYINSESGDILTTEEMKGFMWYLEGYILNQIDMEDADEPTRHVLYVVAGPQSRYNETFEIYNLKGVAPVKSGDIIRLIAQGRMPTM